MRSRPVAGSIALLSLLAAVLLGLFPPQGLEGDTLAAAMLMIAAVGFWATGILPEHVTALLFFLTAMLFAIAPPQVVFSGFSSTALWLIFGGLFLGAAINSTGLGRRMAYYIGLHLQGSYLKLVSGIVLVGVMLGFVMPSSLGRVVLLMPIVVAMLDHFGYRSGSKGRLGLILAAALGAHVPTFAVLPANVPNMVLAGSAETLYGTPLLYGEYLLLHFPVLGVLKAMLIIALITWLYREAPEQPQTAQEETLPPFSTAERRMLMVLLVAIGFWVSDFLHHISPAWIALSAAIFLMLPFNQDLLPKQAVAKINYNPLFFVAGIMGLGTMMNHTGLGEVFADALLYWLPLDPQTPFLNYLSLWATSFSTGLVATLPGVGAVLSPLAEDMAAASGFSRDAILMTQVLGFSTIMLPYQSAPLVVAMQLGKERVTDAIKICLVLTLFTAVLLLPLDYLWWRFLGVI